MQRLNRDFQQSQQKRSDSYRGLPTHGKRDFPFGKSIGNLLKGFVAKIPDRALISNLT